MSPRDRQELRARGHALKACVVVSADKLSPAVVEHVRVALQNHDLLKIRILAADHGAFETTARDLAARTSSQLVQLMGRTALLHRQGPAPRGQGPSGVTEAS